MALGFLPRHYERQPAQSFWLRDDIVISSKGPLAKKAETRFRERLFERLDKTWSPGSDAAKNKKASGRITFRQGRPSSYLKKIKPARVTPEVPIGEVSRAGAESFRVEISHEKIEVHASTELGFRHAFQALFGQFDLSAEQFIGGTIEDEPAFPFRAFLLSLAHSYQAPRKGEQRTKIQPFDRISADVLLKRVADARFNAVIVDVENAVRYRSHPEIARSHSLPMDAFRNLVKVARSYGLEVIPKTNFSKSEQYRHNDWFEPYHKLADGPEYFRRAGKIMDELIAIAKPRYYHIGMDEDHRPVDEYVACVKALQKHLVGRGITPITWIDINKRYQPEIESKMWAALKKLPRKNLILTHWQYYGRGFKEATTLKRMGYKVLCATMEQNDAIKAFALRAHAQKVTGMVGTRWMPLVAENLKEYSRTASVSGQAFWVGS